MLYYWSTQQGNIFQINSGVSTFMTEDEAYSSVLHLSNIALADSGMYTCTATYSFADGSDPIVMSKSVDVVVRGFETHPDDKIADVGSDLTLDCTVIGDQRASISW